MEDVGFLVAPRLPLGDFYVGECHTTPERQVPSDEVVTKLCNNGYGRGVCDRFPHDAATDAIRFHLAGSEPGILRVQFTLEKGCWPAGDGFLDYSKAAGRFLELHPDPIVQRQAEVFLDSVLRRNFV